MKIILTFCAALAMALNLTYGQNQSHQYHPWKEFKSAQIRSTMDTSLFLQANFGNHWNNVFFENKPLETVLQLLDKELPVKKISYVTIGDRPALELIFDNRKQYKQLDQFHFFIDGFEQEGMLDQFREIIGEQETIVPLTKKIRQQLGQIKLQKRQWRVLFMSYTLPSQETVPPEFIHPFEEFK